MATNAEKQACALRELRWRLVVYPRRIAEGKMKPEQARHEIALMEEIARDYSELAEREP